MSALIPQDVVPRQPEGRVIQDISSRLTTVTLHVTSAAMIRGFRHKGLRLLYEADDRSKVRQDQVRRLSVILAALDEAIAADDLDRPSFRLHALKGELSGFWSVTVNGNWRVIFRFDDGQAFDVDLVDYH